VILRKEGLVKRHNWTDEEKECLVIGYKHTRDSVIRFARLFGVTERALRSKLCRLGLVNSSRLWLPKQVAFLRENFDKLPTYKIAKVLGKTEGSVRHKAHRLNVSKFDRDGWFTLTEVCKIIGVTRNWLVKRLNNGFKFDIKPFDDKRELPWTGIIPYYISEESLRNFIRRYPDELQGRNVDMVMLVEILAGVKTEILSNREEDAEKEVKSEAEMVQGKGGTIRLGSSRYTEPPA